MPSEPEMTDVFRFMELRAPFSPEAKALRQNYIRDDSVGFSRDKPNRIDADLQSAGSPSAIGRLVYEHVFCKVDAGTPADNLQLLIDAIFGLLTPYQPLCPADDDFRNPLYVALPAAFPATGVPHPLQIFELERHPYILVGSLYYLLPERLEQISGLKLFPELLHAFEVMERARKAFTLSKLVNDLEAAFGGKSLAQVVFANGVYSDDFRDAKRTLFDTLYLLYILRRRSPVNLEYVIEGLRVLHVIEALAVDSLIKAMQAGSLSPSNKLLWQTLVTLFPELQGWNGSDPLTSLPLIATQVDFLAYFTATPVIHPIFARLHWYKRRFNDIKPIGVGDLKVVKQWLTAYLPGEISHIENVLIGETKDRTHRRLEKTEEAFSFSSDSKESSQKDTQSTDRLELKREVDNVVKSETSVGVNTNSSFTGSYYAGMVVITANVGATFGYKRDTSDQSKISDMFSQETISKAVEQVEKNVSERRSVTKLLETEETTKHGFENKKTNAKHVCGIYRWLDKKYKAQLFNYGKRMMFEFVIPEPAAFFVESRIRNFEATLEIPQPPDTLVLAPMSLDFTFDEIEEVKFQELRQKYDLSDVTFPERTRLVGFVNQVTGENLFEEFNLPDDDWGPRTFPCKLNAKHYTLTKLIMDGNMGFRGKNEGGAPEQQNSLVIIVDGTEVVVLNNNQAEHWPFKPAKEFPIGVNRRLTFTSDTAMLTIGLWDGRYFRVTLRADLELSPEGLIEWQMDVFNKIKTFERQKVDKINQEKQLAYNTEMATYRNRLDQLKAQAINGLLQGQSEAFNRELIRTEIKKHCITMLTKEFDEDLFDDVISSQSPDAMGIRNYDVPFRKFKVTETDGAPTTVSFKEEEMSVDYPAISLDAARWRGRFIQFLEQAFEWRQLAYIFYPYFWAKPPKWIEMMNRHDDGDPNMTAFLQAGSVRVLLAVTPAHDDAVLHFLATREPWDGGPAPVIGDPLFIPLHEELRKQQDDLYNAVPEGTPWTFVLPTSLVYLDGGGATWPTFPDLPI